MTDNGRLSRREFLKLSGAAAIGGAVLSFCAPEDSPQNSGPYSSSIEDVSIRILWTGDSHGHLRPLYHREAYGENFLKQNNLERGSLEAYFSTNVEYEKLAGEFGQVGGYAHLATLINQERNAYPQKTLLLESGDAWYGSSIALLSEMRAPVEVMNSMGYDAMTFHWELNMGKDIFLDRVGDAKFSVLAQNLTDMDFGDRILEPSLIKQFGDIRVAIVGESFPFSLLTTEDRDINPGMRMGYQDIELQEEIDRVRSQEGADVVVLLSHMGYAQDRVMAERLTGVDVIVGGHSHDILWQPEVIGSTILVQGGSHGKFLGELDLEIRDGKLVGFKHQLLPVLTDRIEPDADIEALINSHYQPFEQELSREIGESNSLLYRRALHGGTTDAFVGSAYREIMGTDLSCLPGWRFGATLLPGVITVEDVYNVMKPTSSPLYNATLIGERIKLSIEDNFDNVFNPDPMLRFGGDTLRCTGIETEYIRDNPRMERLVSAKINGEPIENTKTYTVATSGGRTQYLDPDVRSTDRPAVEELVEYIESNSPITADEPISAFTEVK